MKAWPIVAAVVGAYVIVVNVAHYREWNQRIPAYAGRVCDEVWAKTRTTEPTVRWYHACIRQVGIERREHRL